MTNIINLSEHRAKNRTNNSIEINDKQEEQYIKGLLHLEQSLNNAQTEIGRITYDYKSNIEYTASIFNSLGHLNEQSKKRKKEELEQSLITETHIIQGPIYICLDDYQNISAEYLIDIQKQNRVKESKEINTENNKNLNSIIKAIKKNISDTIFIGIFGNIIKANPEEKPKNAEEIQEIIELTLRKTHVIYLKILHQTCFTDKINSKNIESNQYKEMQENNKEKHIALKYLAIIFDNIPKPHNTTQKDNKISKNSIHKLEEILTEIKNKKTSSCIIKETYMHIARLIIILTKKIKDYIDHSNNIEISKHKLIKIEQFMCKWQLEIYQKLL